MNIFYAGNIRSSFETRRQISCNCPLSFVTRRRYKAVLLTFYGLKEALCDTNFFSFVFTVLRTRLREKRDIEGNLTMDLLLTALCGYCTLCQVRFILQTLWSHISIEENGNYCSTYNIHTYGKW